MPTLDQLIVAFTAAHDEADWLQISQLNDYTQPCVEAEVKAIKTAAIDQGADPASALLALKPKLEVLATMYQSMQQQCSSQRDAIAEQLGGIHTGRTGTREYISTSSL